MKLAIQARAGINAGVRNCLVANQVLTDADLAAMVRLRQDLPDLRLQLLVDSIGQLVLIEQWCLRSGSKPPFDCRVTRRIDQHINLRAPDSAPLIRG